ncbi:SDR family NAD(P)-dependent oxidoreductase [uncultured Jannaschia sp.]|uniref:SDR family NAD(P)-dependent oxidoreductase n=1 Tax=uncultured Jannaschia sp. TaxID=293347 RepID=UPI00261D096E|nr:SDR family NAD(P)-dependent oxidoreductase [uncultured Jannaschia sp.]
MADTMNALVTGANKGIGFAIARQLGARGYRIWLGCRDEPRGRQAAEQLTANGITAQPIVLDVTSDESVDAAAKVLSARIEALDVLVNNAGMHFGFTPPTAEEPLDQMATMFEVNALGAVRVTQAFLPLLRRAETARIVMMSSGLGSISATLDMTSENWTVPMAGYCASKAALNMYAAKFAKDLAPDGIKVNVADPGLTATDLTGGMGDRTPEEAARVAVTLATLGPLGPTAGFYHGIELNDDLTRHEW